MKVVLTKIVKATGQLMQVAAFESLPELPAVGDSVSLQGRGYRVVSRVFTLDATKSWENKVTLGVRGEDEL